MKNLNKGRTPPAIIRGTGTLTASSPWDRGRFGQPGVTQSLISGHSEDSLTCQCVLETFSVPGQFTEGQVGRKEAYFARKQIFVTSTSVSPQTGNIIFSPSSVRLLYFSKCGKVILPFFCVCLLKFKSWFYFKNQIIQEMEKTAASMVVVATAKSTNAETVLGAQEEMVIRDQMHLTHGQVITSCWCDSHSELTSLASHLHFHQASSSLSPPFHLVLFSSLRKLAPNLKPVTPIWLLLSPLIINGQAFFGLLLTR